MNSESKQCPKCGYERQSTDYAPAWQCPRCGVAYIKVHAHPDEPNAATQPADSKTKLPKQATGALSSSGKSGGEPASPDLAESEISGSHSTKDSKSRMSEYMRKPAPYVNEYPESLEIAIDDDAVKQHKKGTESITDKYGFYSRAPYLIFRHPSGAIEAVKLGWSWPAFFFVAIWATVKRLWGIAGVTWIASILAGAIARLMIGTDASYSVLWGVLSIGAGILFGSQGNYWRGRNLVFRGYDKEGIVTAFTAEGAIAVYLKAEVAKRNLTPSDENARKAVQMD